MHIIAASDMTIFVCALMRKKMHTQTKRFKAATATYAVIVTHTLTRILLPINCVLFINPSDTLSFWRKML